MRDVREGWSRRDFVSLVAAGVAGRVMTGAQSDAVRRSLQDEGDASGLAGLSLGEAADLLRSGKVSPVELTQACLQRIERLDPRLNAFITVAAETALVEARHAETEIRQGRWKGPLHGIPVALKDLVDTAGVRTTAASALFNDRVPTEDAEVVRRLKAAGAVLLGKLNMHELAFGASTVVSAFGPVRNPWALEYSAGGSSAGSAASVAARLCYGAIGSDTGGSIRLPAAYCGVVGLKPTFGRVSTRGVIPLSWSLDHVGPITRRVRDAGLMLQALAGCEAEDPTCAEMPVVDYTAFAEGTKPRLGIPRKFFYEGLHPDVQAAMSSALSALAGLTASQREVEIEAANEISLVVLRAEAYAYHQESLERTPELYQPETLKRIRSGAEIGASAYIIARRKLDELRRSVRKIFDTVDLLVTPTAPVPPFQISELLADMDSLRGKEVLTARNTRPFNTLGLPTVSVPCGFTSGGLPIGLQITGPPGGEAQVLRLAHAYEQATDWHRRSPITA